MGGNNRYGGGQGGHSQQQQKKSYNDHFQGNQEYQQPRAGYGGAASHSYNNPEYMDNGEYQGYSKQGKYGGGRPQTGQGKPYQGGGGYQNAG